MYEKNKTLAMYGISFANYFIPLFGVGTVRVVALAVLTVFFILNLVGIDKMAKFQNLIVVLMCIALGLLAAFGIGKIQPDYMTNGFLTNGVSGLFKAAGLLTFAVGGGYVVVNLSAEAKNPTKDIPKAIIIATSFVAVLYAIIAIVAAGVLPVEEVAGKSLNVVAEYLFPAPVYVFAVICVVSGLDVSILGNLAIISSYLIFLMISLFMWKLPAISEHAWEKSKFKVSSGMMKVLVGFSSICAIINIYLNAIQLTTALQLGNVVVVGAAFIYASARVGKVDMDISYEEN